jgi:hypothetical protein
VKVLHCSLIGWERHATASQGHLALAGELVWRQHNRPRLHRRLTLRIPSGTLGMGVATWVTMRVTVTILLTVTLSLASEPEPLPLPGTLIGTPLWSGMLVMGLTRLSAWWRVMRTSILQLQSFLPLRYLALSRDHEHNN